MLPTVVTKMVAGATALCCCAVLSGCFMVTDYNKINRRFDPDLEVPDAYHQTPEAYHRIAYYVLSESKKQPEPLTYVGRLMPMHETWYLRGKIPLERNMPLAAVAYPVMAGVHGSGWGHVVWNHELPDMVFFVIYMPARSGNRKPMSRFYRDSKDGGRRVDEMVLAFHPGQPAPSKFRIDFLAPDEIRTKGYEARQTDRDAVFDAWEWQHEPFKPNWSLFYPL